MFETNIQGYGLDSLNHVMSSVSLTPVSEVLYCEVRVIV